MDNFGGQLQIVLLIIFAVVAAVLVPFAIWLVFMIARAENEQDRRKAKKRIVHVVVSMVLVGVLFGMLTLSGLMDGFTPGQGGRWITITTRNIGLGQFTPVRFDGPLNMVVTNITSADVSIARMTSTPSDDGMDWMIYGESLGSVVITATVYTSDGVRRIVTQEVRVFEIGGMSPGHPGDPNDPTNPPDPGGPSAPQGRIVTLNAGHGAPDPGAVNGSRTEAADNLRMSLAVGAILQNRGVTVRQTRTTDVNVPWGTRTGMAAGSHLSVSIHRDAFGNPSANGVTTFHRNGATQREREFTTVVHNHIMNVWRDRPGGSDRGVRPHGYFFINNANTAPAILLELGFISNNQDNTFFDANFNRLAVAIANGIIQNLNAM
ncbi:MAG: N-acetylmuramoyl-L-alanine amidase [Firmicutes bacterium]|nr:N-acetylmuramoyl-L-alanine amidase [Bacillota bacterium]